MANADLLNASDTAVTGWGGSAVNVPARSITANDATTTDAQKITGLTGAHAILKANSTAAQKANIAGLILDLALTDLDLSTPAKRKAARLKKGLSEMAQILAQIANEAAA